MKNIKLLANDGLHPEGVAMLQDAGFEVTNQHIPQDQLPDALPEYQGIIVRSATQVRADLIDRCPNLKVIARAGVGLDNIDVEYAKSKGIKVINTPGASSRSVAELVFAHIFTLSRMLQDSNRNMPTSNGDSFKSLKKQYAKGREIKGQTLGIIGMGKIGRDVGQIALGLGMNVIGRDPFIEKASIDVALNGHSVSVDVPLHSMEEILEKSDVITLHVPFMGEPLIGKKELAQMKKGSFVINAARGGLIDEAALCEALNSGHLGGAGLDVFSDEPTPAKATLSHPGISLSPHIGGNTLDAQRNIALDLAGKVIEHFEG